MTRAEAFVLIREQIKADEDIPPNAKLIAEAVVMLLEDLLFQVDSIAFLLERIAERKSRCP